MFIVSTKRLDMAKHIENKILMCILISKDIFMYLLNIIWDHNQITAYINLLLHKLKYPVRIRILKQEFHTNKKENIFNFYKISLNERGHLQKED